MNNKLSIIIPTIRTEKWQPLYESIQLACKKYDFEIIFVGPKPNTEWYGWSDPRIKFIKSYASPNTCQQLGLLYTTGKFCTHFADDCLFEEDILDKCLNLLSQNTTKSVVIPKYSEGSTELQNDDYYLLNKAYPKCQFIEDDWVIFNSAIFYTEYLKSLGGWDCCYKVPAVAHADLAVRAQRDRCNVIFIQDKLAHCEHGQKDHTFIELSHVYEDFPIYKEKFNNWYTSSQVHIDINNWQQAQEVWKRYV